jgi:hypothetical protein
MSRPVFALLLLVVVAAPSPARGHAVHKRRFALVIGANQGGPHRQLLRHAVSDARAFARLVQGLGGVRPTDAILLEDPTPDALTRALSTLGALLTEARAESPQIELIFYYSGHSDSEGLLLRGQRLSYAALRQALREVRPDFRIAILDSCASGTFTRAKGGARVSPFLADASSRVTGEATLTSSSAEEASQESDQLGASFFTHHLITGLRGAADMSRDGKVTLTEAYQFAFHETLARTETTRAGAQHPAYEIDLAGIGDVVLTDLRGARAVLAFDAVGEGRYFIRDADSKLAAELNKRPGTPVELGLEEGTYSVVVARRGRVYASSVALVAGGRSTFDEASLKVLPLSEANLLRGSAGASGLVEPPERALQLWRVKITAEAPVQVSPFSGMLTGTYYFQPLIDDGETPPSTLDFLQHPDFMSLAVFMPTRVTNLSVTLGGRIFPWKSLGASATVGLTALTSGMNVSFQAGLIAYLSPAVKLSASYLNQQARSDGPLGGLPWFGVIAMNKSSAASLDGTFSLLNHRLLLDVGARLQWQEMRVQGSSEDEGSAEVLPAQTFEATVTATYSPVSWLSLGPTLGGGTNVVGTVTYGSSPPLSVSLVGGAHVDWTPLRVFTASVAYSLIATFDPLTPAIHFLRLSATARF